MPTAERIPVWRSWPTYTLQFVILHPRYRLLDDHPHRYLLGLGLPLGPFYDYDNPSGRSGLSIRGRDN